MNTPEQGATMQELRRLHAEQALPAAAELFMAATKPSEELYDLQEDPHELRNLLDSEAPEHRDALRRLREAHHQWVYQVRDTGLIPEVELVRREQLLGSRQAILSGDQGRRLLSRLLAAASGCPSGDAPSIDLALEDGDPAVRYWGWIGVGLHPAPTPRWLATLPDALRNPHAAVRLEAARAAVRHAQQHELAMNVLIQGLQDADPTVRWHAAVVLDEIDMMAKPAMEALRRTVEDGENKYVSRVARRALAEMESLTHGAN